MTNTPITLSIAGSDSGGGAGIQADIKAISATGGYACTVITATTAQNTLGVTDVHAIPLDHIEAQLDAVFTDLNVQAVKIGMLANAEIIQLIARKLRQYQPKHIVLDPVMVATSGDLLLQQTAIQTLIDELLPLATLITPNLPEAATLLNTHVPDSEQAIRELIPALPQLPTKAVLLKGGHLESLPDSND
ncbi:MAG: bifunctional hydroxymethylpyrimidine kinase/phosphomethylpyrimidine kinase, partial [Pseudomonadota bacterium]|nr:bifunctional hydroxymethylpyrimidine kinase/phosphomethylpyrimidine kinase [Pseudomonadota bacterium]